MVLVDNFLLLCVLRNYFSCNEIKTNIASKILLFYGELNFLLVHAEQGNAVIGVLWCKTKQKTNQNEEEEEEKKTLHLLHSVSLSVHYCCQLNYSELLLLHVCSQLSKKQKTKFNYFSIFCFWVRSHFKD